ncbi:transposase [Spirosoma sp. BT702]|uniref:Transposase n=1 Tax=Spirosoma profusum TaxID=2771354 RepID=A0A926XWM4_9BACT|nr:transposase [Spirosoma profusum]
MSGKRSALKTLNCKLARSFISFSSVEEAVARAINDYNTVRPHASLDYLTAPTARTPSDASMPAKIQAALVSAQER